jgi:hypothetical protein
LIRRELKEEGFKINGNSPEKVESVKSGNSVTKHEEKQKISGAQMLAKALKGQHLDHNLMQLSNGNLSSSHLFVCHPKFQFCLEKVTELPYST